MLHAPTVSEEALWQALRVGALGVAFKRQAPLGERYIADFFAPSVRLVVEVDGGAHRARARRIAAVMSGCGAAGIERCASVRRWSCAARNGRLKPCAVPFVWRASVERLVAKTDTDV